MRLLLLSIGTGTTVPAAAALVIGTIPGAGIAASATAPMLSIAPSPAASIADHVSQAAQRFDVPERWIHAVMRVESGGDVRAISPAGAMGLMQIMPATWAGLRVRYGLGNDAFDPHDNIMAGTAFLREMYDRYGSPGFLAAYNAGPGRYDDYLSRGRRLPSETIGYLASLAPIVGNTGVPRHVARTPSDPFSWTRATLFSERSRRASTMPPTGVDAAADASVGSLLNGPRTGAPTAAEPSSATLFVPVSGGTPR